jgi:hypothetical protein
MQGKLTRKRLVICPICGIDFNSDNPTKIYCSPECAERGHKKAVRKYYNRTGPERINNAVVAEQKFRQEAAEKRRRRAKKPDVSIEDIAVMARKEHLTYGQYVAKYGL